VGIAFAVLLPGVAASSEFQGSSGNLLSTLVLLPVVMLIDALILAAAGTTIGAACTGFRIETVDHQRLSLKTALRRNLLVYFRGLGIGIPIITIFTFWNAYRTVNSGKLCSWDEDLFTRPFNKGGNVYRTTLTALLVVAVRLGPIIALAYLPTVVR
jgi:hypothetical protein